MKCWQQRFLGKIGDILYSASVSSCSSYMFLIYYTDKPLLCIYYDYMNEYAYLLTKSGRHIRSLEGCDITLI